MRSPELEALDSRLGRLRAALPPPGAGGKSSSPSNGYHSLIEPAPDAVPEATAA